VKTVKRKPMTEEQKRLARNAASRAWKKANPAKVKKWNKAWAERLKKKTKKKSAKKKASKEVKPDTFVGQ